MGAVIPVTHVDNSVDNSVDVSDNASYVGRDSGVSDQQNKPPNSLPSDFEELSDGTKFTTKELENFFKKFKKDFPDEKMSKKQFVRLFKQMFETDDEGYATEFCDHVFRLYDKDNNGFIDFREFVTTMSIVSNGNAKEKLHWAFQLYDKDNSGYLTENEIVEVLSSIYKSRENPNAKSKATKIAREMFSKADDSGDNKLSEAEFVHLSSSYAEIGERLQVLL